MRLIKFTIGFLIVFFSSTVFPTTALANNADFTHTIVATYEIDVQGNGSINYYFRTKNIISNNYLREFDLTFPFKPMNLSTVDSPNPITVAGESLSGSQHKVTIRFLEPIYGGGEVYDWSFRFEVSNFVIQHAMQKAIILPTFINNNQVEDFSVNLILPKSLGALGYVYNEGEVIDRGDNYLITYRKKQDTPQNYLILVGNRQDFQFITSEINIDQLKLFLPQIKSYQKVYYNDFPDTIKTIETEGKNQFVQLRKGENINAILALTATSDDSVYIESKQSVTDETLIKSILDSISIDSSNVEDRVLGIQSILNERYGLREYLTTHETLIGDYNVDSLNPAELNQLLRELLTYIGIDNRGVFGYVFPVQPFPKQELLTEQHIWTEFWDGQKWVSIDPLWIYASQGTDYIGKNSFHHVVFGYYTDFDSIKEFFMSANYVDVIPLNEPQDVSEMIDLEMSFYKEAFLNKEYKILLENNSNQPVNIQSLTPVLVGIKNVRLTNAKMDVNSIMAPMHSTIELTIPLDYGLIFNRNDGRMNVRVDFLDNSTREMQSEGFITDVSVSSNISNYLAEVVVAIIFIFVIACFMFFVAFRRKLLLEN